MPSKILVVKFLLGILLFYGLTYGLASLSVNGNNIFGSITMLLLLGPMYLFDMLGIPVLQHTDMWGTITWLGWMMLGVFYWLVAYALAWIWTRFQVKKQV